MTTNDVIKKNINIGVKPNVTFILPYLGEYSKVIDVIENINRIFINLEKTFVIIDDGSKNKEFSRTLIKANKYIVVRHETTKGFGACVNVGLRETKTKYAIIIHSDVKFFDKNCIINLLKEINKPEMTNVAIMSSVSNNPMAHEDILKRNQAEDEPARIVDTSFLPLYCACVNVRAFASVGGVPEFPYAWFEDEAVCTKLKKHGYNLAVCPSSYVYHQGMGTISGLVNSQKNVLDVMKNNFNMLKNFIKDNT